MKQTKSITRREPGPATVRPKVACRVLALGRSATTYAPAAFRSFGVGVLLPRLDVDHFMAGPHHLGDEIRSDVPAPADDDNSA
ncbi:hypothetical protein QBA75_38820 [Streptomyces stelliscabiei]